VRGELEDSEKLRRGCQTQLAGCRQELEAAQQAARAAQERAQQVPTYQLVSDRHFTIILLVFC
jgi:hypothetical protein